MRYILKISYDGSNYSGFQIQKNKLTIQQVLESAFEQVFRERISIVSSGRTDAGVSAFCQVCHFDYNNDIDVNRSKGYINSLLPDDIQVLCIDKTNDNFHARFDCKKKTYEYYFYISKDNIPVYKNFATKIGYNLDIEKMIKCCKCFEGTHDFSAFCASNTEVVNNVRTIYAIKIIKIDECLYKLTITGNGFLYNMVRIIMGTIVAVGNNKISMDDVPDIIKGKDRSRAGKTMPSVGLYLKNVEY